MDGTKLITDTLDNSNEFVIDRRPVRAEVFSRGNMDLMGMRIQALVGS